EESIVFGLEKTLHFLLDGHAAEFEKGDGKTELFGLEGLDVVLKHLDLYLTSRSSDSLVLRKGVVELPKDQKSGAKKKARRFLSSKAGRHIRSIEECTKKFRKAHKLVHFMMQHKDRIKYQYDVMDSKIIFRVETTGIARRFESMNIMQILGFGVEDFSSFMGTNTCTACGSGDVTQLTIRLIHEEDKEHFRNEYLEYMFEQLYKAFKRLPPKSILLQNNLPILSDTKIFNDILRNSEDHRE
uniref:hypothetical protein n=1 Tax=Chitinimonas sp. TaxID=1934313 RepID=UPI0035B2B9C8